MARAARLFFLTAGLSTVVSQCSLALSAVIRDRCHTIAAVCLFVSPGLFVSRATRYSPGRKEEGGSSRLQKEEEEASIWRREQQDCIQSFSQASPCFARGGAPKHACGKHPKIIKKTNTVPGVGNFYCTARFL